MPCKRCLHCSSVDPSQCRPVYADRLYMPSWSESLSDVFFSGNSLFIFLRTRISCYIEVAMCLNLLNIAVKNGMEYLQSG